NSAGLIIRQMLRMKRPPRTCGIGRAEGKGRSAIRENGNPGLKRGTGLGRFFGEELQLPTGGSLAGLFGDGAERDRLFLIGEFGGGVVKAGGGDGNGEGTSGMLGGWRLEFGGREFVFGGEFVEVSGIGKFGCAEEPRAVRVGE